MQRPRPNPSYSAPTLDQVGLLNPFCRKGQAAHQCGEVCGVCCVGHDRNSIIFLHTNDMEWEFILTSRSKIGVRF